MTTDEDKKLIDLLNKRLEAFGDAVKAARLGNTPHILIVFNDELTSAHVGSTPHFEQRMVRIIAMLDVIRHECRLEAQEQRDAFDQATTALLKSAAGSTLIN